MEIKEFISNNKTDGKKGLGKGTSIKKKVHQAKRDYSRKAAKMDFGELSENKPLIMLCVLIVLSVLAIVLGMLVYDVPIVTACIVIVIEAALAACLHDLPIWVHGVVLVAEIILGVVVAKVVFMILVDLCYLAAIYTLKFQKEMNR